MSSRRGIFCLNSDCRHYFEDHCMKMFEECKGNMQHIKSLQTIKEGGTYEQDIANFIQHGND